MNIISLASQLACGKDTLAAYLVEKLRSWRKIAFADAMKDILCDVCGVDREFVEKWKREPIAPDGFEITIREALQLIGNDFRKIKNSVWVDLVIRQASRGPIIISDTRYDNESLAVKQNGGISVLIYRPGFENRLEHPSEQQVGKWLKLITEESCDDRVLDWKWGGTPLFDIFINNDGSIEDLHRKADRLILPYVENTIRDKV